MLVKELLATILSSNSKPISVDIYDQRGLQVILFELPGYENLSSEILDSEVNKLTLLTVNKIRIDLT